LTDSLNTSNTYQRSGDLGLLIIQQVHIMCVCVSLPRSQAATAGIILNTELLIDVWRSRSSDQS